MDLEKAPTASPWDPSYRLESSDEGLRIPKGPHNLIDNRSEIKSPKG
jgi:hypothetical protein